MHGPKTDQNVGPFFRSTWAFEKHQNICLDEKRICRFGPSSCSKKWHWSARIWSRYLRRSRRAELWPLETEALVVGNLRVGFLTLGFFQARITATKMPQNINVDCFWTDMDYWSGRDSKIEIHLNHYKFSDSSNPENPENPSFFLPIANDLELSWPVLVMPAVTIGAVVGAGSAAELVAESTDAWSFITSYRNAGLFSWSSNIFVHFCCIFATYLGPLVPFFDIWERSCRSPEHLRLGEQVNLTSCLSENSCCLLLQHVA